MYLSLGLLQLLLLTTVTKISNGRSICKSKTALAESGGLTYDVMEMGRYMVRTIMRTDSVEVQLLITSLALDEATGDIQYKSKSFIAVLQPKDLKKVCIYMQNVIL